MRGSENRSDFVARWHRTGSSCSPGSALRAARSSLHGSGVSRSRGSRSSSAANRVFADLTDPANGPPGPPALSFQRPAPPAPGRRRFRPPAGPLSSVRLRAQRAGRGAGAPGHHRGTALLPFLLQTDPFPFKCLRLLHPATDPLLFRCFRYARPMHTFYERFFLVSDVVCEQQCFGLR